MVLVITVTKKSVSEMMDKLWNIALNMTLTDDAVEVINKDYFVEYIPGDSIAEKKAAYIAMMQADIDKYKSEQTIYNAAALDTAVTDIGNALEV